LFILCSLSLFIFFSNLKTRIKVSFVKIMVSNAVTFWSYLTVLIPSYFCLFFVLYYLLFDRSLRHGLNNHVILVILIIDLICEVLLYPWLLYFSYSNGIWIRSIVMCEIWSFMDWGLYITHTMLFSWATIERHILIFHDKWVSTKKKRLFVHYLPLILLVVYCVIFYSVINFFPPCQNILYNPYADCLFNCVYYSYIFTMYETVVHQIIPSCSPFFLLFVFSHYLNFERNSPTFYIYDDKYDVLVPVYWVRQLV
jgi:hypothetical protein